MTLKEQLILLLLHRASYAFQAAYYKQIIHLKLQNQSLTIIEIKEVIAQLEQATKLKTAININSDKIEKIKQLSKKAIMIGEAIYPRLWYQIVKPPLLLFYEGDITLLKRPLIAVVGSRKTTMYGEAQTQKLVRAFAQKHWVSVSGLAKGIDTVVHHTANQLGEHSTIAIIASGLNRCYPKTNALLQEELCQRHLVLSEYLPDSPPLKHHFIMRNRLVAGIAPILCVMEAAKKSGSLITANYALQFNREIFALPGRTSDMQSVGCNDLIAAGATPILSIEALITECEHLLINQHYLSMNRSK